MSDMADQRGGSFETAEDAGKGKEGVARRWCEELDLAGKKEADWRTAARETVKRFRGEADDDRDLTADQHRDSFNILWANTEVMRPVLYNSTPTPDVRRRFRDEDKTGKQAAVVLERALGTVMDSPVYDFDYTMSLAIGDLLLPGRAVTRVRYEPTLETITPEPYEAQPVAMDEMGFPVYAPEDLDEFGVPSVIQEEPYEQIVDQQVYCEPVQWEDFRRGPGSSWEQVQWVAFRHLLTRDELREKFPRIGGSVELDYSPVGTEDTDSDDADIFKRAEVWEIWDKGKRQVLFVAKSHKEGPLKVEDDPLGLAGFFPIPRPLYAVETSDSLVPIDLFSLYKDQADELNRITWRINRVVAGLKVRGVYDSTLGVMEDLMAAEDNTMLPTSDEALGMLQAGGSLDNAIWLFPIERIAQVLAVLHQQRTATIQTIYEITGLSDILRGQSDPRETRGAQEIKAQTGSRRLRKMQRDVQRYVRDLMRIKAEIMAEHFEVEKLEAMTGEQIPPEVEELLRDDLQRHFRVDIETDSTVSADERYDQESLLTLLSGVGQYISVMGPVVQAGYIKPKPAIQLLESVVRHFRLGRKIEDAFEANEEEAGQEGEQQQEQPPSPEEQRAQAEMQQRQMEFQAEQEMRQAEFEADQQRKNQELQADLARKDAETKARMENERIKTMAQIEMARAKQGALPQ